ncbi:MAG: endonuclease III [Myxococcales bacterium]|nr:endonuclease III [Myxococcales bacterium]
MARSRVAPPPRPKAPRRRPAAAAAPAAAKPKPRAGARVDVARMFELLCRQHPDAHCELDHTDAFQLVVATVLSAQATDVAVNKVTPELFRRWRTAAALARAKPAEVEKVIGSLGFFRQKTKSITGLATRLVEQHGGQVPRTLGELTKLPGVGRKTANVVLGVAFGAPEGVVVDTHVLRLAQRLGWSRHDTPEKVELDLMRALPKEHWDRVSHTLIFHGRRVCSARKPACAACSVSELCPSAFRAEQIGRKPPRVPTSAAPKRRAKK